jgi:SAM-dependent methyltransferase
VPDEPRQPDPLELYRWAVQDPETHATVLSIMYQRVRGGREASVLREDFAGTCAESVAWVALKDGRRAVAVDLDAATLAWARRRAGRLLGPRAERVAFIEGDSLGIGAESSAAQADIISVLNFSILYLDDPERLGRYLSHARECLAPDGILVLNVFGGPAAVRPGTDRHRVTPAPRLPTEAAIPPFDYLWEVQSWDPQSRRIECAIHFELDPDGQKRRLPDAFTYHWRLWSLAELTAACSAAGFSSVQVWRHTYDPSKGAAGVFLGPVPAAAVDGLQQWTAYVVAGR